MKNAFSFFAGSQLCAVFMVALILVCRVVQVQAFASIVRQFIMLCMYIHTKLAANWFTQSPTHSWNFWLMMNFIPFAWFSFMNWRCSTVFIEYNLNVECNSLMNNNFFAIKTIRVDLIHIWIWWWYLLLSYREHNFFILFYCKRFFFTSDFGDVSFRYFAQIDLISFFFCFFRLKLKSREHWRI